MNNEKRKDIKAEQYKTKGGQEVPYQLTFNFDTDPGKSNIQWEGDRNKNIVYRRLNEGEYAGVEVKYSLDKNFIFDGSNKIESIYDVAFLFRKLEQSAIENAFVIYLKNQKPIIQHISMGSNVGTVVWYNAITDGIARFEPDKVYFLHCHPSGNIEPSLSDYNVISNLKLAFPQVKPEGIIIDIDSGIFTLFSDHHREEFQQIENKSELVNYRVLKFDRQLFNKNVERLKIETPEQAASIIATQRLGSDDKLGVLILSNGNRINANIHLPYSSFGNENIFHDTSAYCARFGGKSVLFYGRIKNEKNIEIGAAELKKNLEVLQISLLDFINFNTSPEIIANKGLSNNDYKSFSNDGILSESQYKYAINHAEKLYLKANPTKILSEKELNQNVKLPTVADIINEPKSKNKGLTI